MALTSITCGLHSHLCPWAQQTIEARPQFQPHLDLCCSSTALQTQPETQPCLPMDFVDSALHTHFPPWFFLGGTLQ